MAVNQRDRDAFATKCIAELAKLAPTRPFRYQPESFQLVDIANSGHVINLVNFFDQYGKVSFWQRGALVKRQMFAMAHSFVVPESTPTDARANLRPKIRERIMIESLEADRQIEGKDKFDFAFKTIGEHLTLEVALDMPTAIRSVKQDDLDKWGLSFDDALFFANQNLLAAGTNRFRKVQSGLYVSNWHDDCDCSRMHLPEVISSVAVVGRPVAMIPSRDCLILTGVDDPAGLVKMASIAEDALQKHNPMSGIAFRLDNGWVPFLPPRDHPAFPALHKIAFQSLYGYYSQQKEWLDKLHEKREIAVFIASFLIGQDKATSALESAGTWSEGVPTLLPRTDTIRFVRPKLKGQGEIIGKVKWDSAYALLSDLMERQDTYPERYLVQSFPTKDQLAQLPVEPLG